MKTVIFIIAAVCFGLILYYGSGHKVSIHWLPSSNGPTHSYQDVKTDTDIHDAIDFVN